MPVKLLSVRLPELIQPAMPPTPPVEALPLTAALELLAETPPVPSMMPTMPPAWTTPATTPALVPLLTGPSARPNRPPAPPLVVEAVVATAPVKLSPSAVPVVLL